MTAGPWRPPLLAQVPAGRLARLQPAAAAGPLPAPEPPRERRPGFLARVLRHLTPVLLPVSVILAVVAAIGVAGTLTDGRVTALDLLRLAILLLAVSILSMQVAALMGWHQRLSRVFRAFGRPVGHVPGTSSYLLLEQVPLSALEPSAESIGHEAILVRGRRRGLQHAGSLLWWSLVAAVLLIAVGIFLGLAYLAADAALDGAGAAGVAVRAAGAGVAGVGFLFLLRMAVLSYFERRRRRAGRLLQRLLRYLLRLFDQVSLRLRSFFGFSRPSPGGLLQTVGAQTGGLLLAPLSVAAALLIAVTGSSALAGDEGDDQAVLATSPTPTAPPAVATPTPTLKATATPIASPAPTPAPTAAPTPTPQASTPAPKSPTPTIAPTPANPCTLFAGVPPATATGEPYPDFAQQLAAATNRFRAGLGLPALAPDPSLQAAAEQHARFVVETQWWLTYGGVGIYDIHCNAAGQDQLDRALAFGYTAGVGENVAWGDIDRSPDQALEDILSFPGHEPPEDPLFVRLGVACYTRADTQEYACAQVMGE